MHCAINRAAIAAQFANRITSDSPDVCAAQCRHRGLAFRGGIAGRCLEGIVELYNNSGCHVGGIPAPISARLSHRENVFDPEATEIRREVHITALNKHTYRLRYMVEIAGVWTLSVLLSSGEHIAGELAHEEPAYLSGSPFDVTIEPAEASPYTTSLVCESAYQFARITSNSRGAKRLRIAAEGSTESHARQMFQEFIIEATDNYGNKLRRGGTPFVATCLGVGRLISIFDCKNGQVSHGRPHVGGDNASASRDLRLRAHDPLQPTKGDTVLLVTLMGKDLVNSPFNLSLPTPAAAPVSDTVGTPTAEDHPRHQDPFAIALSRCKAAFNKQTALYDTYNCLSASLVKEQREATKSYHSTRLQIVHTLPVKFTVDDPDPTLGDKRRDLIARHNRLTSEIEELAAEVRATESARSEVLDELVTRFETSSNLHKDAVAAYKVVRREIDERVSSTKERRRLADALRRGDSGAVQKFEEARSLEETLAAYYNGSDKPENVRQRIQLVSRQYMPNEVHSGLISTTPDRPNTPAFWMMEGRFKPSRAS
ncbi:filamin ABP280 repeat-containing protein, putative [Babesia caballi]|uniref:Filamin ABP280 repeat-containing protein, putative n=1 Tax=Babesia caballi TaxID=5871 RepID=A0AAV4LZZ2_BABCB|nr:filamin ABP280 repeat-containing protein, putative [Babesia caballi]